MTEPKIPGLRTYAAIVVVHKSVSSEAGPRAIVSEEEELPDLEVDELLQKEIN